MGDSCSWIAIRGKSAETVLVELGLRRTGKRYKVPDAEYTGQALPTGWYVLGLAGSEHEFIQPPVLAGLSGGCEIVAGDIETHVMYSSACGWRDGRKLWSLLHDPEKGRWHLDVQGAPPAECEAISERLRAEQRKNDAADGHVNYIIDIPVQVVEVLTGYNYDDISLDTDAKPYEELERIANTRSAGAPSAAPGPAAVGGWLSKLLRRG